MLSKDEKKKKREAEDAALKAQIEARKEKENSEREKAEAPQHILEIEINGEIIRGDEKVISEYAHMRTLLKRDGRVHVAMINSFSDILNVVFRVDERYTKEVDDILTLMQKDGFEIIDVKFNVLKNKGVTGIREGFFTLVTYKSSN